MSLEYITNFLGKHKKIRNSLLTLATLATFSGCSEDECESIPDIPDIYCPSPTPPDVPPGVTDHTPNLTYFGVTAQSIPDPDPNNPNDIGDYIVVTFDANDETEPNNITNGLNRLVLKLRDGSTLTTITLFGTEANNNTVNIPVGEMNKGVYEVIPHLYDRSNQRHNNAEYSPTFERL